MILTEIWINNPKPNWIALFVNFNGDLEKKFKSKYEQYKDYNQAIRNLKE